MFLLNQAGKKVSGKGCVSCHGALLPSATPCSVPLGLCFLLGAHSQIKKGAGRGLTAEDWKGGRRQCRKRRECRKRRDMKTTGNCSCNTITMGEEEENRSRKNKN